MTTRRPARPFRPMDQLQHEEWVEFKLFPDRKVWGRLLKGITNPASRTFYYVDGSMGSHLCQPIGWRERAEPARTTVEAPIADDAGTEKADA